MIKILLIIIITLFINGITATSYCDQQVKLLQSTTGITRTCVTNKINIKTCCDLRNFYLSTKPSGVYQMQHWCGEKWATAYAFCDAATADGGWTVIQRRVDGSENFDRPWSDYEKGFGDLNGEFWYGLKAISCITLFGQWEVRIDFEFENTTRSYLHYNVFKVGSTSDEYPLTISGFTGITPTDPFSTHQLSGMKFTTYDNDNDNRGDNCAEGGNGGWWHNRCWNINANLKYNPTEFGFMSLAGTWYNPRWIEMKIRPLNCISQ